MERIKEGTKLHIPTLVLVAGIITVGTIATEICKVIAGK